MGMVNNFLNQVRHEFSSQKLDENSVKEHPIEQLESWIEEAVDSQILEPNAMSIASVNQNGEPSQRIVYARGIEKNGIRFYTNYHSSKGKNFANNGNISALFFYAELERQIRIEGKVQQLSAEESDAYFNARPFESKIGAWASNQSETIANRGVLEQRIEEFKSKFPTEVPRPPHWGGYLIIPHRFEFWQGRPARLHDRIIYELDNSKNWKTYRVAP